MREGDIFNQKKCECGGMGVFREARLETFCVFASWAKP